jgi:protein SCO1/2
MQIVCKKVSAKRATGMKKINDSSYLPFGKLSGRARAPRRVSSLLVAGVFGCLFLTLPSVAASSGDTQKSGEAGQAKIVSEAPGQKVTGRERSPRPKPNYTRETVRYSIPEVVLTGHDGKVVDLASALGKDESVMVNFVFTSCTTICPVLSASFSAVSRQMDESEEDVEFLSISIDPEYDTQEKLAAYADKVGAGGDWLFFTGSGEDIRELQTAFDTYRGNKMNHLPLTFLKRSGAEEWTRLEGFPSVEEILSEYRSADTL